MTLLVGLPEFSGWWIRRFSLFISFHHGSPCSYITWVMSNRSVGGCSSKTYSHPFDMIIIKICNQICSMVVQRDCSNHSSYSIHALNSTTQNNWLHSNSEPRLLSWVNMTPRHWQLFWNASYTYNRRLSTLLWNIPINIWVKNERKQVKTE
jgi:hypothetical protein